MRYAHKRFDRTIEDTGVLVPGVGEVFRITNPGEGIGENVLRDFAGCTTCPNQPKPTRNYDGLEFRLRKRLSNNWSLTSSYLYSRLFGNYSGLTSSDENNRNSPERQPLLRRPVQLVRSARQAGVRACCRPIGRTSSRSKAPTTCRGARASASTGSPRAARRMQTQMSEKGIPFYPFGRGDLGRTAALYPHRSARSSTTSGCGGHDVKIGLNIENLFDQDIVTRIFTTAVSRHFQRDRSGVLQRHVRSGRAHRQRRPAPIRPDARFGKADQYQRGARCGCRSATASDRVQGSGFTVHRVHRFDQFMVHPRNLW